MSHHSLKERTLKKGSKRWEVLHSGERDDGVFRYCNLFFITRKEGIRENKR